MKIAIVGGGIAAFEAAVAARQQNADAKITIYSRESVPPYRRPALSGMVAHDVDDSRFFLKNPDFYVRERIALRLNATVSSIDPSGHVLSLTDGEKPDFDRLILATGGRSFVPPVPGLSGERMVTLREFSDLERLRGLLASGRVRRSTVLGGGVLGLELAASLLERGCLVTVVETAPCVLSCNLDAEAGKLVFEQLSKLEGLTLKFGVSAAEFDGTRLFLGDGVELDTDLVCVSAGMRSNTGLAAAAGLSCGRGIVVDERMRVTGVDGVFAAGDVAEYGGCCRGLYNTAKAMGNTAGINAAGGNAVYVPEASPVRFMAFGLKLFSAGCFAGMRSEGGGGIENYRKLFYDAAGNLRGVVLLGDLSKAVELQNQICRD